MHNKSLYSPSVSFKKNTMVPMSTSFTSTQQVTSPTDRKSDLNSQLRILSERSEAQPQKIRSNTNYVPRNTQTKKRMSSFQSAHDPRVVQYWINQNLQDLDHDHKQGGESTYLKKYRIDKKSLQLQGLTFEKVSRLHTALFVYSFGVHQMLSDIIDNNPNRNDIGKNFWKVFSLLIEDTSKKEFQSIVNSMEKEKTTQINEITYDFQEEIARISNQQQKETDKYSDINGQLTRLKMENDHLNILKNEAEMSNRIADDAFDREITTRVHFESHVNQLYGAYKDLKEKHQFLMDNMKMECISHNQLKLILQSKIQIMEQNESAMIEYQNTIQEYILKQQELMELCKQRTQIINELTSQLQHFKTLSSNKIRILHVLQAEYEETQNELRLSKQDNVNYVSRIEEQKIQIQDLNTKLSVAILNGEDTEFKRIRLQLQVEEQLEKIDLMKQKKQKLAISIKERNGVIQELQSEKSKLDQSIRTQIGEFQSIKLSSANDYDALTNQSQQISDLVNERKNFTEIIQALEFDINLHQDREEVEQNQLNTLRDQTMKLQNNYKQTNFDLLNLKNKYSSLQQERNRIKEEQEQQQVQYKSNILQSEQMYKASQQNFEKVEKDNHNIKMQMLDLQQTCDDLMLTQESLNQQKQQMIQAMQEVKNRNMQYAINLANKKEKTLSVAFKSSILRKVIQHAYQSKEPQVQKQHNNNFKIIQKAIHHVQREINEREKILYYDVLDIVTEGIEQQQQQLNQSNFFSLVKKEVIGKVVAGPGRMVGVEQSIGPGRMEQFIDPNVIPNNNNDVGGFWGEVGVSGGVAINTADGSNQDDLQRLINLIEQGKIYLSEKNNQIENQNKFILFLIILIKRQENLIFSYWHEIQSQIREINDHHTANQKSIQKIMEEKQALKQLSKDYVNRDGAINIIEIPLNEKYPSSPLVSRESVSVTGTKQISSGRINNMKVEKKEITKIADLKVKNIEVLTKMEPYEPLKINQSTPIRIGPLDEQKKRRQSSSIDIQRTTNIELPVISQTRKQSIQLDLGASRTEEMVQRTKTSENFVQQTELPHPNQQKRIQMPQINQEDLQVKKKQNIGSKIEMPIIMEDEHSRLQVVHQSYQNFQNQKSNDVPVQLKQNKIKTQEKDINRKPVDKYSAVQIEKTSAAQEIQKNEIPHTQQQKQKIQEILFINEMPTVMEETSNEEFIEIKQKQQNGRQKQEEVYEQHQDKLENDLLKLQIANSERFYSQNSSQSEKVKEQNSRQSENLKEQNYSQPENMKEQNSSQSDSIKDQNQIQPDNTKVKKSRQTDNIEKQKSRQTDNIEKQKSKQSEDIPEQKSKQSEDIPEQKSKQSEDIPEQKSKQSENVPEQKSKQSEKVKEQKSKQSENVKEQKSNILKLELPKANNQSSEQSYYENQLNNSSLNEENDQIVENIAKSDSQRQIYEDFIQQNLIDANQVEQPDQIQSQRDIVESSEGQLSNKKYAAVNTDNIRSLPKLGNEFKILYQNASDYYKVKENI